MVGELALLRAPTLGTCANSFAKQVHTDRDVLGGKQKSGALPNWVGYFYGDYDRWGKVSEML